jgi:DNA-binding transcriptional LysR family regulator
MNLSTFDLNLVRVLDALLREHSTLRAGKRLALSQPAVSSALSRLRHTLGDDLFVREGQRLVPTEYARGLEAPIRRILEELEATLAPPATFDPQAGDLDYKIAGSDFFAEMLLPALSAKLMRAAPGVRLQLVDLRPENYVGTLERHEVDLALAPESKFPEWVTSTFAFSSRFVIIARAGHERLRLAGVQAGATIPLDLFCELGHVAFSPEGKLKALGDAALAKIGRERKVVVTAPTFTGVRSVVVVTDLIGMLPQQLAAKFAREYPVQIYLPPMIVPPGRIHAIWHRRNEGQPAHRWMRGLVLAVLAGLDRSDPDAGRHPVSPSPE